jgi:hypothetical protein
MPFLDSLDIANRALDHLGQPHIVEIGEDSKAYELLSNAYDKLRQPELRRNSWKFAKRTIYLRAIDTTTMLLAPQYWNAVSTYQPGSIVQDENEILWSSTLAGNQGNDPATTTVWERYFGAMTADLWVSTNTYFAGELVYVPATNPGSFVVYLSRISNNADVPNTATPWSATTQYGLGDVVSNAGSQWRSLIPYNLNITPATVALAFSVTTTYSTGQAVTGSDGFKYTSVGNGNIGNDPVLDAGVHWTNTTVASAWTALPVLWPSASSWVPIFAGLTNILIPYPLGAGPFSQAGTKNFFHLPSGYLRTATIDPKGRRRQNDWDYQGDYIVSGDQSILLAFTADVTEVTDMDPMFCEGMAARMALEVEEPLLQSSGKFQQVGQSYQTFMGEARAVDAIEREYEEPPEDDYLTVRVSGFGPWPNGMGEW